MRRKSIVRMLPPFLLATMVVPFAVFAVATTNSSPPPSGSTASSTQSLPIILAADPFSVTATGAIIKVSTDVATTVTVTFSHSRDSNQTATGVTSSVAPFDAFISLGLLTQETAYTYIVTVQAANGLSAVSGTQTFTTRSLSDAGSGPDASILPPPPPAPTPDQLFSLAVDALNTVPSGLDRLLCKGEREKLQQGGLLPTAGPPISLVRIRSSGDDSHKKIILETWVRGVVDIDVDGLNRAAEVAFGTSDTNPDTDGDGKDDCTEIWGTRTDPRVRN